MAQRNGFYGVTIGAILLGGLALVAFVAICLQALYLRQIELERQNKSGLEAHAEFAELTAAQLEALEGDFAVLERDTTGTPTKLRLPIGIAMERALESALETSRTSAK